MDPALGRARAKIVGFIILGRAIRLRVDGLFEGTHF